MARSEQHVETKQKTKQNEKVLMGYKDATECCSGCGE